MVRWGVGCVFHLKTQCTGRGKRAVEKRVPLPDEIQIVAAFPLTSNGKVDRKQLQAAGAADTGPATVPTCNQDSPTFIQLRKIFADILEMEESSLDPTANFFAMGGSSILGIQVISKARERGMKISPEMLFENPSIVSLVAALDSEKEEALPGGGGVQTQPFSVF